MSEIVVTAPMIITSRLLPGVKIGDGMLSVELGGIDVDGKVIVSYALDFAGESPIRRLEYVGNDVRLAMVAGDTDADLIRKAASTLLAFLASDAEQANYGGPDEGDGWAFNEAVATWALDNDHEIWEVKLAIDES